MGDADYKGEVDIQRRWSAVRDREGTERSVEEKGSEVGLGNFNREKAEERTLRVGKQHRQSTEMGMRIVWQVLIGISGQPERALELGTAGHHLGWWRCWSWRGA